MCLPIRIRKPKLGNLQPFTSMVFKKVHRSIQLAILSLSLILMCILILLNKQKWGIQLEQLNIRNSLY